MKTIEQLKAEHAAQLKALEGELALAQLFTDAGLPVPEYIGGKLYGAFTVHYWNRGNELRGLSDALDIALKFPAIVPAQVLRSSCTTVHPWADFPQKEKERGYKPDTWRNLGDFAFSLRVNHIARSQTKAELCFFARINGKLFSVSIDFGRDYIGGCARLAPETRTEKDGRTGRTIARTYSPNRALNGYADSVLSFASGDIGPIKESANHVYLFIANDSDELPASEHDHAMGQLENLAVEMGETIKRV